MISNVLVLLFVYTALSKLINFEHFKSQLSKSPYIASFSNIILWLLPGIELLIGLTLISIKHKLLGFYSSLFALSIFTIYILTVLSFSNYIPCSCGGVLASLSWTNHILFNLTFILFSVLGIILLKHKNSIARLQGKDRKPVKRVGH
ncbi:MauE/DoxX family redox-associated membrane protein [Formosa sp. S-31]|uniref:MauE/DoxX family redox-associated membrane protein n=1 Tax=Formosa sp. S-31 TaxID=2790949 RepID=UPI003EB92E1E